VISAGNESLLDDVTSVQIKATLVASCADATTVQKKEVDWRVLPRVVPIAQWCLHISVL